MNQPISFDSNNPPYKTIYEFNPLFISEEKQDKVIATLADFINNKDISVAEGIEFYEHYVDYCFSCRKHFEESINNPNYDKDDNSDFDDVDE